MTDMEFHIDNLCFIAVPRIFFAIMDEYNIDIKIEGSKLASLSSSQDKNSLKYESDSMNETMKRQK